MKSRSIEAILVLLAATLFVWGVLRAANRGDAAAKSWTTYVMSILVVLAGLNIFLRFRTLAAAVLVVSALFLVLALAAALLSQADRNPHPVFAVMRAIIFLALLGLTGWIQMNSTRPPASTSQRDSPASESKIQN